MRRLNITAIMLVGLLVVLIPAMSSASTPISGAAFTTVNQSVDGTGHCQNGNPDTNCNIYDGKQYVWLSGGPGVAYVGDGDYFFAVLDPGGQADPNDGAAKNLSDDSDAYTNRTFSVSGGTISYSGSHNFDGNKIRLLPYANTSNPGGVYILAICSLAGGYPVNAPGCKYDAFKVQEGETTAGSPLTISKDADGAYNNTYTWTIAKAVDKTLVKQSGSDATFEYTVSVSHDGGTISGVTVTGQITVFNPNDFTVTGNVSDVLSDGTVCAVTGGANATFVKGTNTYSYSCNLAGLPQGGLDNTASVDWAEDLAQGLLAGSADFMFSNIAFAENTIDECASVTDTYAGMLGPVCVGDANPTSFTYSRNVSGAPGTCTSLDNTATFTTNDTGATDSASQSVKLCVGADLTVSKTANPAFKRTYKWNIAKSVDKTVVKQLGGTATFNYTVNAAETGFTDSEWAVTGKITVSNPNDWESVTANVSDAVDNGGSCTVAAGTGVSIPAGRQATLDYTCTYASAPSASSGTNTATASWDHDAAYTPDGSASGTANFSFSTPTAIVNKTVTVTDSFNGGAATTLGTLTAIDAQPFASAAYNYSRTINVPANGCFSYPNIAKIVETGQTASQTVKVCGPAKTGALTMGFWQNKNGQGIITGQAKTGTCASATWLRQYAPFQDLGATATCAQVGTYVTNVIKAANASGSSMNAMLKAQMLATALDVYFSDPALGGNKIGAPAPIGGVAIDLTKICKMIDGSGGTATCGGTLQNASAAFGGAASLTVSQMLGYAASQSNAGGSVWYGQVKATQELAKNAFDAINNQVAFAP